MALPGSNECGAGGSVLCPMKFKVRTTLGLRRCRFTKPQSRVCDSHSFEGPKLALVLEELYKLSALTWPYFLSLEPRDVSVDFSRAQHLDVNIWGRLRQGTGTGYDLADR